mgnify:CR=1 FL=1
MCGIVGIVSIKDTPINSETVKAMNNKIYRRGPDDEGFYFSDRVCLGMRRLSIIDIAAGHQPIFNEDNSIVIVFNGEIYNHNELRAQLKEKGHTFRTNSDTEVIVHLYEEYGIKFLDHLRGMFGLCIWDSNKKTGYLCRDRFGIKPIFTAITDSGHLLFASELKAILASEEIKKIISPEGLDAYLAYNYIPAPLTIYEGIFKLPPAHYIAFTEGNISAPTQYWDANDAPVQEEPSLEEIDNLIKDSITVHMESDVPIGTFLSGGIDSSLVTAVASTHEKFHSTFTIGFENSGHLYDERPLAKLVADKYSVKNSVFHNVKPDPEKILTEAIRAFDEPFADDSIIPTWEICELASQQLKVCLTGLGGDELFGGYYRYLGIQYYGLYAKLPLFLRSLLFKTATKVFSKSSSRRMNHIMRFLRAGRLTAAEAYTSYLTALEISERENIYSAAYRSRINDQATKNLMLDHFNKCKSESLLQKAIYTDINTYVAEDILALSDRVSMWHSLELRVPLLDHVLFEKCFKIREALKIGSKEKIILLRKVAKKYLPAALFVAKKQGFESPTATWINSSLKEYIDSMLDPQRIAAQGIFNPEKIQTLIDKHRDKSQDNSKIIFSLLMFQIWHKEIYSA